jgi:DeoD family purine-nucleoside phosphorylase
VTTPTPHLRPTAPLAERVLLPGDPGRALMLAQVLLDEPRMFNHRRGLWGYTGRAPDGEPATIQSSGMGGPSAAIVVEELARLGARRIVRVGSCGLLPRVTGALGDLVIAREALTADGASRALGASDRVAASASLTRTLEAAAHAFPGERRARGATVASTDLFYDRDRERAAGWVEAGALAVEMEAATLFRCAELLGIEAGCVLVVSDLLEGGRRRIEDEALTAGAEAAGRIALDALMRPASPS